MIKSVFQQIVFYEIHKKIFRNIIFFHKTQNMQTDKEFLPYVINSLFTLHSKK